MEEMKDSGRNRSFHKEQYPDDVKEVVGKYIFVNDDKTSVTSETSQLDTSDDDSASKKRRILIIVALMFSFIAGAILTLAFSGGWSTTLDTQDSAEPFLAPSGTEEEPHGNPMSDNDLSTEATQLLLTISGAHSFQDPKTAQSQALKWLATADSELPLTQTQTVQRYILATLLYATSINSPWGTTTHWLTQSPECSWHGVTCDSSQNIIHLVLDSNNLNGPIPHELGHLTQLQQLLLPSNQLQGQIPPSIANLPSLTHLDLSTNKLNGPFPTHLLQLQTIQSILLHHNAIQGNLPQDIHTFPNSLHTLSLNNNEFIGNIPINIGLLTQLQTLQLHQNALQGTIPDTIAQLQLLNTLTLHYNQDLTGSIPHDLCLSTLLTNLTADCNQVLCDCCTQCYR